MEKTLLQKNGSRRETEKLIATNEMRQFAIFKILGDIKHRISIIEQKLEKRDQSKWEKNQE